ncbi:universal stress protein [Nitrosarchaeum sp.]|nr:universal stress protein [Nitrosarchaeum sp.]
MTYKALKKILVPLDGSKHSLRGLNLALVFAKSTGTTIIGLNVFSYPSIIPLSLDMKNKIKKKSEEVIKQAKAISQKANVTFTGITKINDNVGNAIITVAEKHRADIVVIGSSGPDPESNMFLGSVANYVVNKSTIPVVIVK